MGRVLGGHGLRSRAAGRERRVRRIALSLGPPERLGCPPVRKMAKQPRPARHRPLKRTRVWTPSGVNFGERETPTVCVAGARPQLKSRRALKHARSRSGFFTTTCIDTLVFGVRWARPTTSPPASDDRNGFEKFCILNSENGSLEARVTDRFARTRARRSQRLFRKTALIFPPKSGDSRKRDLRYECLLGRRPPRTSSRPPRRASGPTWPKFPVS